MALAPLNRPDGSTQVLRYRGQVTVSQANADSYPKVAGVTPADSAVVGANFLAYIRLPFFDPADLTDTQRRLPANVFDDSQLAPASPHAPVACVASATPGVNITDLSMNRQTWAQNVEITSRGNDLNLVLADSGIAIDNDPANGAQIVLDTLTSGLGTNTGLPVLVLLMIVVADEGAAQAFDIDVTIEVRDTNHR